MAKRHSIDLKAAINAVSDVVQNRPRPLRENDQIYMKTGDMVLQCEMIAGWVDGRDVAFIGDGDAISVCLAYLQKSEILAHGPKSIKVFDFDERICKAVTRFADAEGLENLSSQLYNCLDDFPEIGNFDCFYTNPPWGASNDGNSVKVFTQRGIEAIGGQGEGVIVIADDHDIEWPQVVLAEVQKYALEEKFYIQKMASKIHLYHLDDNPDLKSCNLFIKSLPGTDPVTASKTFGADSLVNFYGSGVEPTIQYVREKKRLDYGMAHDDEYEYELRSES